MTDRYRKNFIRFNMLLIGAVLFLSLSVIYLYLYRTSISDLRNTMSQLTRPVENSSGSPAAPPFQSQEEPEADSRTQQSQEEPEADSRTQQSQEEPETETPQDQQDAPDSQAPPEQDNAPEQDDKRHEKAISIFFYHADSGTISLLSKAFVQDADALREIAEKISRTPDSFGELSEHHLYFYKRQTDQVFRIAVADSSYIRNSAVRTFGIMLVLYVCAMFFFFWISIRFSAYAVRPLEEEMRREKQFVADTSHDLKTPVAVILANTGILRRNRGTSVGDLMQWVDGTETAARNMQLLIEEMLTLSDVEASGKKIELQEINISDTAEMVSLFLEPVAYEKNIGYRTDISENIFVKGNEAYIKRIFQILIENAVKYEPAGGEIAVSLSQKHGRAVFSVTNQLSSIAKEDLPYLFDRFYRSDRSRKSNGGHGLGLAIAKSMADAMNAKMTAESTGQAGTVFRILFAENAARKGKCLRNEAEGNTGDRR